uniref:Uncharacterized protein n=1 Tax=Pygocentrus nattereri TaxID=42514 RepID=A0AAR2KNW7_PYGNA
MVLSLVSLCAREVVSDHSSSPSWLSCLPRELYRPLLEAAFAHCRPLAVGELVQRWPERTLSIGGQRTHGQIPPNRLCIQALLLAAVRGLTDKRYGATCVYVLIRCLPAGFELLSGVVPEEMLASRSVELDQSPSSQTAVFATIMLSEAKTANCERITELLS